MKFTWMIVLAALTLMPDRAPVMRPSENRRRKCRGGGWRWTALSGVWPGVQGRAVGVAQSFKIRGYGAVLTGQSESFTR